MLVMAGPSSTAAMALVVWSITMNAACSVGSGGVALAATSNETLKLAKARYEGGVDNHLRYLDAQRSALNDQATLIQISTERQIALANLYKALGGG